MPENSGLLSVVGQLKVDDPDAGDTHRFILLGSAVGRFTLDGDKVVVAEGPALDFETTSEFMIAVRAIDAGGLTFDSKLSITVTDVSEPPTELELLPSAVPENSPGGTLVGTLLTHDPDQGDVFTYNLLASAQGRFQLAGNQIVVADGADLNFESLTQHTIRVKTTDGAGFSIERNLTIAVDNVNEQPANLELSNLILVPENSPAGTVVGQLSAMDVDFNATGLVLLTAPDGSAWLTNLGPTTISLDAYQIESANGKLDPTAWRSIADWAAGEPAELSEALQVLGPGDAGVATGWEEAGLYPEFLGEFNFAAVATLSPNEVVSLGKPLLSAEPGDYTLTYHEVGENAGLRTGTVINQAPLTFSLADSANGRFEIVGNQVRVAPNAVLDFEANSNKLPILVVVTDAGGASIERQFVVTLTNVNEAPVVSAPSDLAVIPDGSAIVPGVQISDPDVTNAAGQQAVFRASVSVDHGNVSLGSLTGLEIVSGASGSPMFTVVGPLAKLNAALVSLKYQAPTGFLGAVVLTVGADDQGYLGSGTPLSGTATTAIKVNHPPVSVADQFEVTAGGELSGVSVLTNDADAEGDDLSVAIEAAPQHGEVVLSPSGALVYKPEAGFVGQDAFTYFVSDGLYNVGPTLVTINVKPASAALSASADFDGDGDVDLTDFGLLKANFAKQGSQITGDADRNGQVDLADFGVLKTQFGASRRIDDEVLLALAIDRATRASN